VYFWWEKVVSNPFFGLFRTISSWYSLKRKRLK
jgi:hypothetical protein